jgi:hypothetical protein
MSAGERVAVTVLVLFLGMLALVAVLSVFAAIIALLRAIGWLL